VGSSLSLAWILFRRTLSAKVRKSFGGYLWLVFPALLIVVGITLATRSGVVQPGNGTLPLPVFALVGVLLWHVVAEAMEAPYQAVEGARSYLTRVSFPHLSVLLAQFFELAFNTAVRLVFVIALSQFWIDWNLAGNLVLVICFFGTAIAAFGVGCWLAPFLVLFSDLQQSFRLLLTYGLFLTPALYVPSPGLFKTIIDLNPIAPVMITARAGLDNTQYASWTVLAILTVSGVVALITGSWFVRRSVPIVVERMLLGGR
jgi:lipopolysaccharide transport system permease protein